MRQNVRAQIRAANKLERLGNRMTSFFKTYATLSPGFHVRNGMSALFMNAADGVPFQTSMRGAQLWNDFEEATRFRVGTRERSMDEVMRAGEKWYESQPKQVRDAFDAVVGSGAGGRFAESGVAEGEAFRTQFGRWILENRLTRASQRAGARVEGSVRMGMALDTIRNGGTVGEAIDRITRVHFDYSQVSRFDNQMKRIFPFWSFMSRNLPLQVMQQWGRPGTYQAFEHFRNNFADPSALEGLEGDVPQYIERGRGIPLNLGPFNWFEPDLPHTRLNEEAGAVSDALSGDFGPALASMNPVLTAPLEYVTGTDFFTGQQYQPDDLKQLNMWNPLDILAAVPARFMGDLQVGEDGQVYVSERLYNSLSALNPVMARADRLGPGQAPEGREWEGRARFMGLPVRTLTQQQMDSEALRRRFEAADQRRIDQALAG